MKVVLKISGESLGNSDSNIAEDNAIYIANMIKKIKDKGNIVSVIIGGGNHFRGREHPEMDKVTADTIGMLGTVMNALILKDYLSKLGEEVTLKTPFTFPNLIEDVSSETLKNTSSIIIYGGGIGKSGYSTDSAVMMASSNNNSDLIIKLTNVDGVYDKDPNLYKDAKMYKYISYKDVINNDLGIMDMFAIKECQRLQIKILVTNFKDIDGILGFFDGREIGTVIYE